MDHEDEGEPDGGGQRSGRRDADEGAPQQPLGAALRTVARDGSDELGLVRLRHDLRRRTLPARIGLGQQHDGPAAGPDLQAVLAADHGEGLDGNGGVTGNVPETLGDGLGPALRGQGGNPPDHQQRAAVELDGGRGQLGRFDRVVGSLGTPIRGTGMGGHGDAAQDGHQDPDDALLHARIVPESHAPGRVSASPETCDHT